MTPLMERAFAEAVRLAEGDQDALAALILREIESERRWDELFARPESHDLLGRMADQALASRRSGRSRKLDPGDL